MDYAPDIDLVIQVNLASSYLGVHLSTNKLAFLQGMNSMNFTVFYDQNITYGSIIVTGKIIFLLTGINQDIFKLSQNEMYFTLGSQDSLPPTITSVLVSEIFRTYALVQVISDEPVMLYYMIALVNISFLFSERNKNTEI
jgi:hypothetical protein